MNDDIAQLKSLLTKIQSSGAYASAGLAAQVLEKVNHIQVGGNVQGSALGAGSSVTTVSSFNTGIQDKALKELFDSLGTALAPLREEMKVKDSKALDENLNALRAEAEKPSEQRDTSLIKRSGIGLIEAAKTVQQFAEPVIETAEKILKFLGVALP